MEWPPELVKFGYDPEINREKTCIKLFGNIYRYVNGALKFHWLNVAYLIKMGIIRSRTNPCLFILKNDQCEFLMLALYNIGITQNAGTQEHLEKFKKNLRDRFKIKDLGLIKKY